MVDLPIFEKGNRLGGDVYTFLSSADHDLQIGPEDPYFTQSFRAQARNLCFTSTNKQILKQVQDDIQVDKRLGSNIKGKYLPTGNPKRIKSNHRANEFVFR